jgi:hypothetical protein
MGDMADFFLEEVCMEEMDRVDRYYANPVDSKGRFTGAGMDEDGNYPQDEEVRNSPAFYEILNFDNMQSVIKQAASELEILDLRGSITQGGESRSGCSTSKQKMPDLDSKWFRDRFKTFEMMKGFAKFHRDRGFLSAKQRNIVDTNWIGGSDKFIADLHQFGHDDIISKYEEISDKLVLIQKKYYSHRENCRVASVIRFI